MSLPDPGSRAPSPTFIAPDSTPVTPQTGASSRQVNTPPDPAAEHAPRSLTEALAGVADTNPFAARMSEIFSQLGSSRPATPPSTLADVLKEAPAEMRQSFLAVIDEVATSAARARVASARLADAEQIATQLRAINDEEASR